MRMAKLRRRLGAVQPARCNRARCNRPELSFDILSCTDEPMPDTFPTTLVVMALAMEGQGLFERIGVPVLFTGVGKVNAAHALTRRLTEYRLAQMPPPHVINFGTAGSQRHPSGVLLECVSFIQRDMDVTGLGVPLGATPFEEVPPRLEMQPAFTQLRNGVCGSGDSFVVNACAHDCDVLDMEGYALAKVCYFERCAFNAVKYVTDGADHAAAQDWQQNLRHAAEQFAALYDFFTSRMTMRD
jgi:adenosylhomocysteine nucleosidase